MTILRTLLAVARATPVERRLVCPECGGAIVLADGTYWCDGVMFNEDHVANCGFSSTSLQPLVPAPTTKEAR